jgi:hypothetical protein
MSLRQRNNGLRSSIEAFSIVGALLCILCPALGSAQAPQAIVSATSHECGHVKQGVRIEQVFTVRNGGTASLTFDLVQLTQPGMTAKFKPAIPPGAEGAIHLEWDTSRVKGPVEGVAVIGLNDPQRPKVQFVITAVVQPPIEFQPFAAVFLSAYRDEIVQSAVRILNNEDRPLKILGMEPTSDRITAAIQTVEAGKIYELCVSVKPDAPFGRVQESLYLLTDHPERSRLRVLVNVLIKPDAYVNPEEVDFGQIQIAEIARNSALLGFLTQTFIVKTRHGEMQLKSVQSDLDFLDIKQSPQEGKAGAFRIDVSLVQRLMRSGPISGSIRITTMDPRFPEITVPVRGEIK